MADRWIRRQDTETFPIRPGLLAPQLVCVQWSLDRDGGQPLNGDVKIDLREHSLVSLTEHLMNPDIDFEHHNGAYDYAVLCAAYPRLTPLVFRMLAQGRGRDTMLRQQLQQIAAGTIPEHAPKGYWSLGGMNERLRGVVMDKAADGPRLRYALLDGVPVDQWPADAVKYAKDDVTELRDVSRFQLAKPYTPPDESMQVAAAFCLQLAAVWGLHVDAEQLAVAQDRFLNDDRRCVDLLEQAGLYSDGGVKRDAVQKAVERACAAAGRPVPRTPPSTRNAQGNVKYDADTCEELASFDPVLTALSEHTTNTKMLNVYLEPMQFGTEYAMTSRPNTLVKTGRTSWSGAKHTPTNPWWPTPPEGFKYTKEEIKVGTNLQNWPQMPGIRECIRPRDGHYLCSVDYNSLELRTLGQASLWLLGRSTFAKGYQQDPNWDPHTYFGGQLIGLDYAAAMARKQSDPTFGKGPRKVGKATNFSLPGGVGAKKLAYMFGELHKSGELPKEYTVEECYDIKNAWLDAYPEMRDYFELAAWHAESGVPVKQLVSNRVRGKVTFSAAANTWFQGLAADLGKRALFYVTQACYADPTSPLYGARVLAFIHDEILLEVPIPLAHECAVEVERLMVKAATEVCPDVPFAAEAALMTYWTKAAGPMYDDQGRMIPWRKK